MSNSSSETSAQEGDDPYGPTVRRPHSSQHYMRLEIVSAMYHEITGRIVGPMPIGEFFHEFLPKCPPGMPPLAETHHTFKAIGDVISEFDMYSRWIDAATPYCCPNLELVDTHAHPSQAFDDKEVKPDVTVYLANSGRTMTSDITLAEILVEFKYDDADDPFYDKYIPIGDEGNPFGDDDSSYIEWHSAAARDTLGQIALYAKAQLAAQFRTHIFSILVFKTYLRFLRWDRSGLVVSQRVELAFASDFLWRYNHASASARGYDEFVSVVDEKEDAAAIRMSLNVPPTTPLVALTLSAESDTYIIGKPTYLYTSSLTGRSTRSVPAYCAESKEIVWLKDTWRILGPSRTAEHLIYEKLHAAKVPYIPRCKGGADVGGTGTRTQEYQNRSWAHRLPKPLRALQHYRLILLDIGRDCTQFATAREFVNVIKNASDAHDCAYFDAGILHRDISVGNILILGVGAGAKGMLIDWDLCQDLNNTDDTSRVGTWDFMSTRLKEWLPNPEPSAQPVFNRLEDDRESFLHVMNWVALRYMHHNRSAESLTDLLVRAFEEVHYSYGVYRNYSFSSDRMVLLTGWAGVRVNFQNKAMRALLVRLATDMAVRYDPEQVFCHDEHQQFARAMEEANKSMQARVMTRGWLTGVLAGALASESGWTPFEGRVEHELVPHHNTPCGTKRKKGSTGYQEDFASLDPTDGPNPNKWRRVVLLD